MTSSPDRIRERLKRAVNGRLPERYRRDDSGLTTLEWLLIVAAVAGLAALAVVLVTNVVGDTSDQISGASARLTAAQLAAAEVTTNARAVAKPGTPSAKQIADFNAKYQRNCKRLLITYGDIDNLVVWWNKDISDASANPANPPTADSPVASASDWDVAKLGCYAGTTS